MGQKPKVAFCFAIGSFQGESGNRARALPRTTPA
jgi:hypothetical protein